jgi:hypothetical protein
MVNLLAVHRKAEIIFAHKFSCPRLQKKPIMQRLSRNFQIVQCSQWPSTIQIGLNQNIAVGDYLKFTDILRLHAKSPNYRYVDGITSVVKLSVLLIISFEI